MEHSPELCAGGPAAEPMTVSSPELGKVLSVLSAMDELTACREADAMLRLATELARDRLGLERVGFYLRDPGSHRIIVRGTWGTGLNRETTDEHWTFHEYAPRDYEALLGARLSGGLGMYRAFAPLFATETGKARVVAEGWLMATPLLAGRDLVGIMYNDTALSRSPVDANQQAAAAVFCTMLAVLYVSKHAEPAWRPPSRRATGHTPLIERALAALDADPTATGEQLAEALGVSAGHLARSFKREIGLSLVEYRHRVRLERFFSQLDASEAPVNLLDAAIGAGFGSYAQFHRVYRKFLGATPRELFARERAPAAPPPLATLAPAARPRSAR